MDFNADLVDDIARRRVVLFVGSGVSASAVTKSGKRIKVWPDFLRQLAKQVASSEERKLIQKSVKQDDFLLAAELLKDSLSPGQWRDAIHQEFNQVAEASDLHRAIVKLNQRIVVTTNFDKLLENAWADPAVDATHFPQVINKLDPSIFRILRDEQNHLIKLHGSVDDPAAIIFAKSDYVKHAYGNWAYSRFVETLLLTHTLLFVGFSMTDPAVSHLVEMHAQQYPDNRPHYIFLSGPLAPQISSMSKRLRRLFIIEYSPAHDHRELVTHITDLAAQGAKRRKEIIAEMRRGAK